MTIFNELDFRMSVVKRWSVVSTIRQQSIAEHSFNVAVMADRIARDWFNVKDEKRLYHIVKRALNHDAPESITGDFPTYMKRFVDESGVMAEFEEDLVENIDIGVIDEMDRVIVKIADYADALIFLGMEISHGNQSVRNHFSEMRNRFRNFLLGELSIGEAKRIEGLFTDEIMDGLFDGKGQYVSELYGFPKK